MPNLIKKSWMVSNSLVEVIVVSATSLHDTRPGQSQAKYSKILVSFSDIFPHFWSFQFFRKAEPIAIKPHGKSEQNQQKNCPR